MGSSLLRDTDIVHVTPCDILRRERSTWPVALWMALLSTLLVPRALSAADDDRPTLYVLAIGVSDYQDDRIPDLSYADDDARGIIHWATTQLDRLYGDVHASLLINEEATRSRIIKELISFFRSARPDDQIVLFIAGHGVLEQETGNYHFFAVDTEADNIAGTAIEHDDIVDKLIGGARDHHRILMLVDTCHAGGLAEAMSALQEGARGSYLAGEVSELSAEGADSRTRMRTMLSAGMAADLAREGPEYRLPQEPQTIQGHGLFTHAVVRALGTLAADTDRNGLVTLSEFVSFVSQEVREGSNGKQLPVSSGTATDAPLSWAVGTEEVCDGRDNNYDGQIDEGFPDINANGVADCLDQEQCNGVDDNANGSVDEGFDRDGDGYVSLEACGSDYGGDCNDSDISIHPGQRDWGNLRDDDCDGMLDEDDFDRDGDGIPDYMDFSYQRLNERRWATLGTGAVMAAVGLFSYGRVFSLATPDGSAEIDPLDKQRFRRWSTLTVAFGAPGAVLVGVGVGFTFSARGFERTYFPAVDAPAGLTGQGQTGRSK